jgi:hypothetical protein
VQAEDGNASDMRLVFFWYVGTIIAGLAAAIVVAVAG